MAIGHLESCQCSECEAARAQTVTGPLPSPQGVMNLLAGLEPQAAEIANSPAYVICIGGVPAVCVLGGDSEFAMEHVAGNLVFSLADDAELPDRVSVQVFAVGLRGQQIVMALTDLTNFEVLRGVVRDAISRIRGAR